METKALRYLNHAMSRLQHLLLEERKTKEQIERAHSVVSRSFELSQFDNSFLEIPACEPLTQEWWESLHTRYKEWHDQQLVELS